MNKKLNQWFWKWHFIAGLVSLPFIIILSVTGGVYLFKSTYEKPLHKPIKEVVVEGQAISYQEQWNIANKNAAKKPHSMILPEGENNATAFISGRFGGKSDIYIDPYKGSVSGEIITKNLLMQKIRKLHGELLLGSYGTKVVELVASWMVVLIITGLFIWWPGRGWKLKGYFIPRTKDGKRTFYRDLHAITGFWSSALLLLILAGAFPWTDVVGDNFKWVQKVTNTGYPATWKGGQLESIDQGKSLTLDEMVLITKNLNLTDEVTISFPKDAKGVFSVSNTSIDLDSQKVFHFDQYSGEPVIKHNWEDVGVLMRGRMWVMAFHQGEFGPWNWWLMLFTAIALTTMSISAIVSYLLRKRKGEWGVPKTSTKHRIGYGLIAVIIVLGVIFPLLGLSLLLLWLYELLAAKKQNKIQE